MVRREQPHRVGEVRHTGTLPIPDHRELDRGLLRDQIRKAGLTVEEFVMLLRKQFGASAGARGTLSFDER
jgi:hypothetical protein